MDFQSPFILFHKAFNLVDNQLFMNNRVGRAMLVDSWWDGMQRRTAKGDMSYIMMVRELADGKY